MNISDTYFGKKFGEWSLIGIDEKMPGDLKKHILLANRINLTLFITTTPYIFLFYALGFKLYGLLLIPVMLLLAVCLFLTSRGANLISRIFLILIINLALGLYSAFLTKAAGMHYLFFVFSATPLMIFNLKKYVPIIFSVLCSVIFFIIIEMEWIQPPIEISQSALHIINPSLTIVRFIWLMLLFVYLVNANTANEKNLQLKNIELEKEISWHDAAEEKLRHYNLKLKLKNKELEQFTYVASHDLQEPLRTITSYAELLKTQHSTTLDEHATKYLDYVYVSSLRMKKLIKDLLDLSRIGRNSKTERTDCSLLLTELMEDMGVTIAEKKAIVTWENLPVIYAFPSDLKLLFQNLIGNAIKFHQTNLPPKINILTKENQTGYTFMVKDNGIGIEKKFQENIFAIFNRLHTRSEYEGNGIGLAHCKKITELHGGTIWVESVPGVGSTFYFTIAKNIE